MQTLDPQTYSKVVSTLPPLSRAATSTFDGAAVDTAGFSGGWAKIIVYCGALDNAVTVTGVVAEATTSGGSYTNITNSGFTIVTTADDNTVFTGIVRLNPRSQFLRVSTTHTVSANACVYAVAIELFHPDTFREFTADTVRFTTA